MTFMFHRIIEKSGLNIDDNGYGFHAIRRCVSTIVPDCLSLEKKIYFSFYIGWSKTRIGNAFLGSPMAGYYQHPEILNPDPHWIDKQIYEVHPFLKAWKSALASYPINQFQNTVEPESDFEIGIAKRDIAAGEVVDLKEVIDESPLDRLIKRINGG